MVEIAERFLALGDGCEPGHGVELQSEHGVDLARDILVEETPLVEELLSQLLPRLAETWPLKGDLPVHHMLRNIV